MPFGLPSAPATFQVKKRGIIRTKWWPELSDLISWHPFITPNNHAKLHWHSRSTFANNWDLKHNFNILLPFGLPSAPATFQVKKGHNSDKMVAGVIRLG